jgi:ABC-type bacteriocin/lantibiotic exporter with double-glycine peptidase domain
VGSLIAAAAILGAQLAQISSFTRMEIQVSHLFQTALFDRVLRLRPAFFRDYTVGDLLRRVLFPWYITQRLQSFTVQLLNAPLIAALQAALIIAFAPEFAWLLLIPTAVIVAAGAAGALAGRRLSAIAERRTGRLSGTVVELIGSIGRIRLACAESRAFASWAKDYAALQKNISDRFRYTHASRLVCSAVPPLTLAWLGMACWQR